MIFLVYDKNLQEHREHLTTVFRKLRKEKLYCNKKKCVFSQERVDFLGHVVTEGGVMEDPTKISVIIDWPMPKFIRDLRGFLGLTGYYRKFVKGYGKMAKSLTNSLQKDKFHRSKVATQT